MVECTCCCTSIVFLSGPAGQSSPRGATAVPPLVCDCQSHRPLLSAGQRAFHPQLLSDALSSGKHEKHHKRYYDMSFSFSESLTHFKVSFAQ